MKMIKKHKYASAFLGGIVMMFLTYVVAEALGLTSSQAGAGILGVLNLIYSVLILYGGLNLLAEGIRKITGLK